MVHLLHGTAASNVLKPLVMSNQPVSSTELQVDDQTKHSSKEEGSAANKRRRSPGWCLLNRGQPTGLICAGSLIDTDGQAEKTASEEDADSSYEHSQAARPIACLTKKKVCRKINTAIKLTKQHLSPVAHCHSTRSPQFLV